MTDEEQRQENRDLGEGFCVLILVGPIVMAFVLGIAIQIFRGLTGF